MWCHIRCGALLRFEGERIDAFTLEMAYSIFKFMPERSDLPGLLRKPSWWCQSTVGVHWKLLDGTAVQGLDLLVSS